MYVIFLATEGCGKTNDCALYAGPPDFANQLHITIVNNALLSGTYRR